MFGMFGILYCVCHVLQFFTVFFMYFDKTTYVKIQKNI